MTATLSQVELHAKEPNQCFFWALHVLDAQHRRSQHQGSIPWFNSSFPDEEGAAQYRITVYSNHAAVPLGKVKFVDRTNDHEIEDKNQDGTWHQIASLRAERTGRASTSNSNPTSSLEMDVVARDFVVISEAADCLY